MQLIRRTSIVAALVSAIVALPAADASADRSLDSAPSPAVSLLNDSLVPPAVDQLTGDGGLRAAREARRENPQAVAERTASRSAFENLPPARALALTRRSFPALTAPDGAPKLASGQRLVGFLTDHAAQVSEPGAIGVLESIAPIATPGASGARAPLDLSLRRSGAGFQPLRSDVGVKIPSTLSDGVALASAGVSLTPIDAQGKPLASSPGALDGASVQWSQDDPAAGVHDLASLAKASLEGFDLSTLLLSQQSPSRLYFRVGMPSGARLRRERGGSVAVIDGEGTLAVISPVSAEDAEGVSVPVTMSVSHDTLALAVDRSGDHLYPIAVDPEVNDSQLAINTTTGKRSNWEFKTNSSHFSRSESGGGSGSERLETSATGGYGPGEVGLWGYQTKGVSHIYGITTVTSAHNNGAKVESFLEFEEPSGAQESKKPLSRPEESPEYEGRPVGLCPVPGAEACLPSMGKANNAVHFEQSTIGSSGTGFSDSMTQGIVSIAEPEGTHSTTSYNTTSPMLEFEAVVEGKKTKLERHNVLYGGGGWLSGFDGALGLNSADPGIGVAATKLEYESSPGHWSPLSEHNYLGVEAACQGVQCYSAHTEYATLPLGLPDGEDTLRYRAEEAISGTQSSEAEGQAKVKVDTKKPYNLKIEGLPNGNELSEREYELTGVATDGEGATLPSSGIKSITLNVDGHAFGASGGYCSVAKGECSGSEKWKLNGAELGSGRHDLVIVAVDNAGNEERLSEPITIHHSTPVALGPGSIDLQSGDFSLSASDVSMGSGLSVARNYSSRAPEAGEGPLGPQWSLSLASAESLTEMINGGVLLTASNGAQTIFAPLGEGKFESPLGDSNLALSLEENKTTKEKLAYKLVDAAAHTSVTFTLPSGATAWVPTKQEGAVATDTVTYAYKSAEQDQISAIPAGGTASAIVAGEEGDIFYAVKNKIVRTTNRGRVLSECALPANHEVVHMILGPGKAFGGTREELWFTEKTGEAQGAVGSLSINFGRGTGCGHEYKVASEPGGITAGPEGAIWFTAGLANFGKIAEGVLSEYWFGTNVHPHSITAGADGNLWIAEQHKIAKVTPSGTVAAEYAAAGSGEVGEITAGPDGNLWYTSDLGEKKGAIGRITTAGATTEYSLPGGESQAPHAIISGPDGALWYEDAAAGKVGRITTSGAIAQYPLANSSGTLSLASGFEHHVWFAGAKVGKLVSVTEPTEALAPKPAGVSCEPELKPGCRALKFKYSSATSATGEKPTQWGEFESRLSEVTLTAYDPASKAMKETAVAKYAYDALGRLRAEWDPRVSPALKKTYGYDSEGLLTALSEPGQEPWIFAYGTATGDAGLGRLLRAKRSPASAELWNGEPLVNTEAPKITGTPRVGVRLTASNGAWSGSSPVSYSYQWENCTRECKPIPGATSANYTPQGREGETFLAVSVEATNGGGSATAKSEATAYVESASPVRELNLPASSTPMGISRDNLNYKYYIADYNQNMILEASEVGVENEYPIHMLGGGGPEGIAAEGGAVYWVDYGAGEIQKLIQTGGGLKAEEVAGLPKGAHPTSIVYGASNTLWFTDSGTGKIGKFAILTDTLTEYALPAGAHPVSIVYGPDGNCWFTDTRGVIGKITPTGAITEYHITATGLNGIAAGPDGNLWYTTTNGSNGTVGKITTAGSTTEYPLPAGARGAESITADAESLWITGNSVSAMYKVTTSGAVTRYALPAGSEPQAITTNSAKSQLWFPERNDKLGIVTQSKLEVTEGEEKAPPTGGYTVDYNVPIKGAGAPHEMSAAEVAKWGQSDDPLEATAIFPPDEAPGSPASSYKRATIYYMDGKGRQVDLATPSNSSYGSIATTEYNEFNDSIRTLSPGNRQTALEAGASSVEKSKLLDTQSTYNGEGAKEGEVPEQGTRLVESDGPQHKVTYVAGHEQKESLARLHSKFFYNEGAPGGETYDLQTKKTTLAQLSNEEEVEVRTTKTSYAGQSNLGWKLRAPTSVTSFGPEEAPLSKSSTEYNPTTGQITEVRGSSAETTMSYAKKFGEAGTEAGKLKTPWGDAVNSEGALLVVDSANNRIEKFSAEGAYVSSFGTAGTGNGQLKEPQGIAIDSSGNVWVADRGNNRIEEFSSTGTFVKTVGSLGTESGKLKAPSDLAFDSKGNLWVADTANSRIEKFNKEGVYSSEFSSAGTEPGKLKEPKGIAIDSSEHVWVADTANNRIQEFSATGSLLRHFGSLGSGEGQLKEPIDLKIDASGDIWTADSKNNRAEAFTAQGAYLTQIGSAGTGNGQLKEPKGVAFDATGKAWVSDSANNRLEQWSKGANAHDQKSIYYSSEANAEYPSCGAHPEYAGLICEILPAKQPELMGLPALPTTTYASYNIYNEPETTTEAFGSSTRTKKETYDAAGRRASSETTASSGKALPKVTFAYNAEQGVLEKETAESKSLTSEFNKLGQLTKYTDADGNVAKYTYAGPEGDYLLSEASDSSASGTTKQSYEYDPTTKLRTKLIDSAAGSFTAAYNTEGELTSESYPHGLCANYSYNSIGEATSLQYLKTSNCTEAEPGIYYSDSRSSSIRGEMLTQESTLANDTYTYDPLGRLSEAKETPAGEGCTVRAYSYDEESNRATSTTRTPGTGGACQAEGGTTEAHNYDEGNRLSDPGIAYDAYGNVTKLPAADAEGHELTSSYYVDNAVASQTQNGVTNEYKLDPEGRTRELISAGTKTIDHYDGEGEAIAWSEAPEKQVRNIAGIDGTLLATQTNGETPVLQLHDLQGDVVATIGDKAGESKLLSSYTSTEFGVPNGKAPPKFAYLGSLGIESSFSSGVVTYGATSYVPQTGMQLQSEAVLPPGLPGGSGAGAPYTMQEEAWNMQGALRAAAEAVGLQAAREQAADEAAELAAEEAEEAEEADEAEGPFPSEAKQGGKAAKGNRRSMASIALMTDGGGSCLPVKRCKREKREEEAAIVRHERKITSLREEGYKSLKEKIARELEIGSLQSMVEQEEATVQAMAEADAEAEE